MLSSDDYALRTAEIMGQFNAIIGDAVAHPDRITVKADTWDRNEAGGLATTDLSLLRLGGSILALVRESSHGGMHAGAEAAVLLGHAIDAARSARDLIRMRERHPVAASLRDAEIMAARNALKKGLDDLDDPLYDGREPLA